MGDDLLSFVGRFRNSTQIFCFQEVFDSSTPKTASSLRPIPYGMPDMWGRLAKQLDGFQGHLSEPYSSFDERLAIMEKVDRGVESGELPLCEQKEMRADKESFLLSKGDKFSLGSRLQWITMGSVSRNVMVANVHGLWLSQGKKDTPERIEQSEKITAFLRRHSGPAILCGDLNLLLDTRSIQILEEAGMRNLIREHAIPSTRTKHYASGKGDFADYVFVSSEIRVRNFQALDEEVSDHLPLLLDFD